MSGLSDRFIDAFLDSDGVLNPIHSRLKFDHTLMLAVRKNYVNIYYRGGNILKITEQSNRYKAEFDNNYRLPNCPTCIPTSPSYIQTAEDAENWVDSFAKRKIVMDYFFAEKGKSEREFQQLIARENNNSAISGQCEYFIADIEFAVPKLGRFDMLAIRYLAKDRKTGKCAPALIEMKYGDNALEADSGLVAHLEAMKKFMETNTLRLRLLETVELRFNQLDRLGLLKYNKGTTNAKMHFCKEYRPEIIFILANHNPRSSKLIDILSQMEAAAVSEQFDVKFFVASFAGYGLHADCMQNLNDFKKTCKRQLEPN